VSPPSRSRTRPCTAGDARGRLTQARAFCDAAELVLDDDSEVAGPGVAAALAVLAGIAAADAACCAAVRERARGQDHREATRLVATVRPGGGEMAKRLERLLASKDEVHYGSKLVSRRNAASLVTAARELTRLAADVVTANP
jgi:hypothetical protein